MIPLLAIRHGRTEWNAHKRLQGHTNIPLSDEGISQVSAWRLPVDHSGFNWMASPLDRAMQTARLLGVNAIPEPALMEMSWGEWEGRSFDEIKAGLGVDVQVNLARGIDFRPDGGESPREVMERLQPWIASLDKPTGIVCHKGVLQALYALATDWDMIGRPQEKLRDAMAHLFLVRDGKIQIDRLNLPLEVQ